MNSSNLGDNKIERPEYGDDQEFSRGNSSGYDGGRLESSLTPQLQVVNVDDGYSMHSHPPRSSQGSRPVLGRQNAEIESHRAGVQSRRQALGGQFGHQNQPPMATGSQQLAQGLFVGSFQLSISDETELERARMEHMPHETPGTSHPYQNPIRRQQNVQRIVLAFRNLDNILDPVNDGQGARDSQAVAAVRGTRYTMRSYEIAAWDVLLAVERAHRGATVAPHHGKPFTKYATFEDRLEAVIENLRSSKASVKQVMDSQYVQRLADAPSAITKSKTANASINKRRNIEVKIGKAAIQNNGVSFQDGRLISNANNTVVATQSQIETVSRNVEARSSGAAKSRPRRSRGRADASKNTVDDANNDAEGETDDEPDITYNYYNLSVNPLQHDTSHLASSAYYPPPPPTAQAAGGVLSSSNTTGTYSNYNSGQLTGSGLVQDQAPKFAEDTGSNSHPGGTKRRRHHDDSDSEEEPNYRY